MDQMGGDKMKPPGQSSKSTKIERSQSLRNYAYKRPDADTEEFMRFIRGYQFDGQPTNIKLQKKQPLPEIRRSFANSGFEDSGFSDKNSDTSDNDEASLDNEVALVNNNVRRHRKNYQIQEVLTLTRSQTRDNLIYSSSPNRITHHSVNRPSSLFRQDSDLRRKMVNKNSNYVDKMHRKQLPPLSRGVPDRPTAPSPSLTPPLPGYNGSFVEEEPIDYIDSA